MAVLKDVAGEAGVSISTVRRAFKGSGYMREGTRRRVVEAARRLGYRPHRVARSLRTRQSYELGVVAWSPGGSGDEFAMARIAGFERALRGTDYSVTIFFDPRAESGDPTVRIVEEVLDRRLAGVVLFAGPCLDARSFAERMTEAGTPYVVFGAPEEDVDSVCIDRAQGVYDAVHYLAGRSPVGSTALSGRRGRTRIAYLGRMRDENRLAGFDRALKELGRPPIYLLLDPGSRGRRGRGRPSRKPEAWGDFFGSGRAAARRFAEMSPRPDAVQAFSDVLALGFLAGLHDMGLRAPEDVALVGFDDRRAAELASPPLTTVAQPSAEAGAAAAEILLGKMSGLSAPPGGWSRVLPTRLVVRETA